MFEPGLRLSTVTTHPSSYPCIDIATDVISDRFKEMRDVNSLGNGPQASEATWTSSGEAREMDLGIADKLCTIDFYHDFNFIF